MKKTKAKLGISLITLIITVFVLLGSTYAWFTDSVSNTGNRIQAGNLKVSLWKHDGTDFKDITDDKEAIFNYDKWEPGYSSQALLKIQNDGNLAFKFKVFVKPIGELETTDSGNTLADVIDVYTKIVDSSFEMPESFADIKSDNTWTKTNLKDVISDNDGVAYGAILPSGETSSTLPVESVTMAVILHMQEEAGNEYQGIELGTSFDIQINATQYTYEKDGFNSDLYDLLADYPVEAEAKYLTGKVTTLVAYDDNNKQAAKAVIPANATLPEDTEKVVMVIEKAEKPSVITLEEDQQSLNVDISFYAVKSNGSKTQITDFGDGKAVSVDLSTILPNGYGLVKVYNTHDPSSPTEFTKVASKDELGEGKFFYDSSSKTMYLASSKYSPFTFVVEQYEIMITKDGDNTFIPVYMSLGEFRDSVNTGNTYAGYTAKVLKDLDYTSEKWTPIGYKIFGGVSNSFQGIFNGNNKTIKVKNDDIDVCDYFGFFGEVYNLDDELPRKRIYDLTLDVDFECSATEMPYNVVGGLASEFFGWVDIDNITVKGTILSNRVAGGLIGNVRNYETILSYNINNCKVEADVGAFSVFTSDNWLAIGGIVGQNDCKGAGLTITNCSYKGKLETTFDSNHQTGASSYIGYVMAKGANDGGEDVTIINNFKVVDGSSITGFQNVTTHNYPFEGLNKATNKNTFSGKPVHEKELLGGYFYKCTIDGETNGGSGQNYYPHGKLEYYTTQCSDVYDWSSEEPDDYYIALDSSTKLDRYVYAPDVSDIYDYIGKNTITSAELNELFFGEGILTDGAYVWLRSACSEDNVNLLSNAVWMVFGDSGSIGTTYPSDEGYEALLYRAVMVANLNGVTYTGTLAKGNIITIDSKDYRVLSVSGTVAELLTMYDAATGLAFNSNGGNLEAEENNVYESSTIDTYLNGDFYNSLSFKTAILEKEISVNSYKFYDEID